MSFPVVPIPDPKPDRPNSTRVVRISNGEVADMVAAFYGVNPVDPRLSIDSKGLSVIWDEPLPRIEHHAPGHEEEHHHHPETPRSGPASSDPHATETPAWWLQPRPLCVGDYFLGMAPTPRNVYFVRQDGGGNELQVTHILQAGCYAGNEINDFAKCPQQRMIAPHDIRLRLAVPPMVDVRERGVPLDDAIPRGHLVKCSDAIIRYRNAQGVWWCLDPGGGQFASRDHGAIRCLPLVPVPLLARGGLR